MAVIERIDRSDTAIVNAAYRDLRRFAAIVSPWDMDPDDVLHGALVSVLRRHRLDDLDDPVAYIQKAIVNHVRSELRRRDTRRRLARRLTTAGEEPERTVYPSGLADLMNLRPIDVPCSTCTTSKVCRSVRFPKQPVSRRVTPA